MRVLHLSDVHVTVPFMALPWRQMLNKRFVGAGNLLLRRAREFREARAKLASLTRFADEHAVDLVICTGDYTALGTEPELVAARQAIAPLTHRPRGYVTVPGNHDIYLDDVLRDGRFERHFGDLLKSDLPEHCVDGVWPIVRLVGEHMAVIAVNSARPNPVVWHSNGAIPQLQIAALERLCADPRLAERFVFVITHYAPRRPDATADHPRHGLDNADALLHACRGLTRGALLHGHIHRRFQLQLPELALRIFGAGSTTCQGREGLWLFDVDDARAARAVPGRWQDDHYVLEDAAAVSF
jgi:3',5'-cyclic AMP phosphodiesterase CpdA